MNFKCFLVLVCSYSFAAVAAQKALPTERLVKSYGILVYPQSKSGLPDSLTRYLQSKGYVKKRTYRYSPIELWADSKNIVKNSKIESSFCKTLKTKFPEVIKFCDANVPGVLQQRTTHRTTPSVITGETLGQKDCSLHVHLGKESDRKNLGLTTFWAQEYIGADLMYKELNQIGSSIPSKNLVVIDTDAEEHYRPVTNLILTNIPPKFVALPKDKTMELVNTTSASIALESLNREVAADVINMSMGMPPSVYQSLEDYSKKHNTLISISAGNEFNKGITRKASPKVYLEDLRRSQTETDLIFVGSMSPTGLVSMFSNEFPEVVISAPSDDQIIVDDPKKPFAGTSGAAPLVSSALLASKVLLPQLSPQQAKKLLVATALPSVNFYEKPQLNGAGTLNSYGLYRLSLKIRESCLSSYAFATCFNNELEKYNGRPLEVDTNLLNKFNQEFACGGDSQELPRAQDACQRKEIFDSLRKQALLNPKVSPYWMALACAHKKLGYSKNAKFYESLGVVPMGASQDRIIASEKFKHYLLSLHRLDLDKRKHGATFSRILTQADLIEIAKAKDVSFWSLPLGSDEILRFMRSGDRVEEALANNALWDLSDNPSELLKVMNRLILGKTEVLLRIPNFFRVLNTLPKSSEKEFSNEDRLKLIEQSLNLHDDYSLHLRAYDALESLAAEYPERVAVLASRTFQKMEEVGLDNSSNRDSKFWQTLHTIAQKNPSLIKDIMDKTNGESLIKKWAGRAEGPNARWAASTAILRTLAYTNPARASELIDVFTKDKDGELHGAASYALRDLMTSAPDKAIPLFEKGLNRDSLRSAAVHALPAYYRHNPERTMRLVEKFFSESPEEVGDSIDDIMLQEPKAMDAYADQLLRDLDRRNSSTRTRILTRILSTLQRSDDPAAGERFKNLAEKAKDVSPELRRALDDEAKDPKILEVKAPDSPWMRK